MLEMLHYSRVKVPLRNGDVSRRVLVLTMYMSRKSLTSHGSGGGVAAALAARALAELAPPPATPRPALAAALLAALAAALDGHAHHAPRHAR